MLRAVSYEQEGRQASLCEAYRQLSEDYDALGDLDQAS